MKKLVIGAMAALACLAWTLPAFAEVKVEGMITTDAYYFYKSKERAALGVRDGGGTTQDSWDTTRMAMGQPSNRISVRYTGEDKVVNGFIQIRAGGSRGNQALVANNLNVVGSESAFSWEYAWIDWHVNPSLYFRFGRQDQVFQNAYAPAQGIGWNDNHIIGLGFGNFSAQSRDGLRAFIKFTDQVRMEVAAYDPNTETSSLMNSAGTEFAALPSSRPGAVALESNVIPRFDISLPIKIANFTIEPGFTWLQQKWDQVNVGDDKFDIWGVGVGASAAFGPFSLMGEFTYGRNLGSGQYIGGANAIQTSPTGVAGQNTAAPVYIAATNQFEDTENIMFFIQGSFNFGPFATQLVFGMDKGKNDGSAAGNDAQEWDVTTWMLGFNVPIYVTKTFTITPSVFYYSFDDSAKMGAGVAAVGGSFANNVDLGYEIIAGVQFNLVF